MIHRRVASPLHAARAGASVSYCGALAAAALVFENPFVLAALAVAVVAAGRLAGVGRELARTARYGVPLALLVALINPLVVREGLTVFARLGEIPPFGQVDLTVEALVYGLVLGARVIVVLLAFALLTAAVDPDELLRLLRGVSMRSALTAVLATRLVPVLARDARRLEEARHCRADAGGPGAPARVAVLRAVAGGALERAVDVAATLAVRGYGGPAVARAARERSPWSRHDLAFAGAALATVAAVVVARVGGTGAFHAYPTLGVPAGPGEVLLAAVLLAAAIVPFTDRRGIAR